jgi:carboxyl-terminal processing protease
VNQSVKTIINAIVGVILLAGVFAGGFLVGHFVPSSNQLPFLSDLFPSAPTITPEEQVATPNELETLFAPFWEAWNVVHEEYVDQPIDDVALMRGAIRGMMDALGDKQTYYMEPDVYERQTSFLQGREYEGIGAYVDLDGEYMTIISPISGSPADQAGLRPGDKIIAIDGEDMTGVAPEEAHLKVLGPAGTTVTLTISREGESEPLEFTITRARISIKSAEGKMLGDGIAYVDINTFGDNTTSELQSTLNNLLRENPRGVIIDLRNNGGGYLHTSVEVASEFIGEGVVLYEQYGDGRRDVYDANGKGQATDLPIVVLVNEGSASASEILAGALQDYERAKLVGVQSYGKGSVQIWFPLSNDEGAARVTIAKWLTPKERAIDGIGLTPDVYVECNECTLDPIENDIQAQAAVETLLAMINDGPMPTSMPTSIPTPVQ